MLLLLLMMMMMMTADNDICSILVLLQPLSPAGVLLYSTLIIFPPLTTSFTPVAISPLAHTSQD